MAGRDNEDLQMFYISTNKASTHSRHFANPDIDGLILEVEAR
jgi:hypothetical protein